MLEAARARRVDGLDVVVGRVETARPPETEALLQGLEILPRQAGRVPRHQAAGVRPGCRPRAQAAPDAGGRAGPHQRPRPPATPSAGRTSRELLAAGIDVYTTLNVQHVESLNDVVAQVSGSRVRETIPDARSTGRTRSTSWTSRPRSCSQRLAEGKVYFPEAGGARRGELLPRGEPDRIARAGAAPHRRAGRCADAALPAATHAVARRRGLPGGAGPGLRFGPSPYASRLVRAARRMAARLQAEWMAVYVETPVTPGWRTRIASSSKGRCSSRSSWAARRPRSRGRTSPRRCSPTPVGAT